MKTSPLSVLDELFCCFVRYFGHQGDIAGFEMLQEPKKLSPHNNLSGTKLIRSSLLFIFICLLYLCFLELLSHIYKDIHGTK